MCTTRACVLCKFKLELFTSLHVAQLCRGMLGWAMFSNLKYVVCAVPPSFPKHTSVYLNYGPPAATLDWLAIRERCKLYNDIQLVRGSVCSFDRILFANLAGVCMPVVYYEFM